jgi:hypothetical protein
MGKALSEQVGGDHYLGFEIQPVEFIVRNELGFLEGNIIKRICRYRQKGHVQDLDKIIHECELIRHFYTHDGGGGGAVNKEELFVALQKRQRN